MKTEKRIHPIWQESQAYFDLPQIIDKFQYIYFSNKGKISLIKLLNYYGDGKDLWEIYSLEGNLLEDVERFLTKTEAEEKIKELLD